MKNQGRILVVDDEEVNTQILSDLLTKEGFLVTAATSGKQALDLIEKETFDLILTDVRMDEVDGFQVLKTSQDVSPEVPVILMTAYADTESVIRALRGGAADFFTKPYVNEDVRLTVKRCLELTRLRSQNVHLRRALHESYDFPNLLGSSAAMHKLFSHMEKVIPLDCHVLITGDSGTGKELVAKAIHFSGPRAEMPFIALNCAALPETLLESELFGHVRGAFTDARTDKKGLVAAAEGGSLFLDEIGEMSPALQVKLLRMVQEKEYRPVGGTQSMVADVRIITATNKVLVDEVKLGHFREDLYFRLNVVELKLPNLREKKEDIPLLSRHFLKQAVKKHGKAVDKIAPEAMKILLSYRWPGNVRELENTIERAVIFADGNSITPKELQAILEERAESVLDVSIQKGLALEDYAQRFYENFKAKYPLVEIAKMLGISRKNLWERRKRWDGNVDVDVKQAEESDKTTAKRS